MKKYQTKKILFLLVTALVFSSWASSVNAQAAPTYQSVTSQTTSDFFCDQLISTGVSCTSTNTGNVAQESCTALSPNPVANKACHTNSRTFDQTCDPPQPGPVGSCTTTFKDGSYATTNVSITNANISASIISYDKQGGTQQATKTETQGSWTNTHSTTDNSGKTTTTTSSAAGDALKAAGSTIASIPGKALDAMANSVVAAGGVLIGNIALLILTLSANILSIVGFLFNWVITFTIFQFGANFGNSQGLLLAWGVLRDIGNIVLLFGFIYLGIMMILDLPHGMDTRKAIPSLLIYALLLNFSLFAAEAVIDLSNIICGSLFSAAAQGTTNGSGIADQIIQSSGIGSIFTAGQSTATGFQNLVGGVDPAHTAVVYIGAAVFVTITAIVLLAASIMLIIRGIVLTLVMVTAPIGFAAMAIPQFSKFAKQWWKYLLSNAFFAPVYLLLVYVSLAIMKGFQTALGSQSLLTALNKPSTQLSTVFLSFALMTAFMIAAIMAAKGMGAIGADYATKTAGGAVVGGQAFIARRTVGRASYMAAHALRGTSFARSEFGRGVVGALDKGATSSFDVRGSKIPGLNNLGLGSVPKGAGHGYEGIVHAGEKERKDYAGKLRKTKAEEAQIKALTEQKDGASAWAKSPQRKALQTALDAEKDKNKANSDSRARELKAAENKATSSDAAIAAQNTRISTAAAAVTTQEAELLKAQTAVAAQQAKYDSMPLNNIAARSEQGVELNRLKAIQTQQEQALTEAQVTSQQEIDALVRLTEEKTRATEELSALQIQHTAIANQETENIKAIDTQLKNADEQYKNLAEKLEGDIKKLRNAPVEQYADNLHHPDAFGRAINLVTAGGAASHHASEALKANLNKNENQKLLDALGGVRDNLGKASGGGDNHAPAPAPKPAGGGGGGPAHH